MYCYGCLSYLRNGGIINYSYKNVLNNTITGAVSLLSNVGTLLAILGVSTNTVIVFSTAQGQTIGVVQETMVNGMAMCTVHAVPGVVSGV